MFVFKYQPLCTYCNGNIADLLIQMVGQALFPAPPNLTFQLCSILSGVRFMLLMFWDVKSVLQNHLHTLWRGVEAIRLVCGLWLLTTDLTLLTKRCCYKRYHHCSLPPSFLPAPLLLPYTYQLLRLVLILSLSCLYLAVHTKPKPACPHSINGTSPLLHLFSGLFRFS